MSGGEYSRPKLDSGIDQVKDLIEGCIKRYIDKSECKHALELQNGIDPNLTEIIWNEIEKQNEEFFRTYYVRLILIEQIRKFNRLLERQLGWMRRITASGLLPAAHMNTHDPSLHLNIGQQASKLAEDMQKLHNLGSSILPSPHGFIDAPLCDRQNIEMYSSLVDAPRDREPSRTVNLQQFGSSTSLQPVTPRMGGYVPYLAPQNIELYDDAGPSSNAGHLQENICMSRYDPKFGSCEYSGGPGNRDATMSQTEMRVMSREDGNLGLNIPGPYGCFVELAALMGDASIGSSSSAAATNPNKSN